VLGHVLDLVSVGDEEALLAHAHVLSGIILGEAPLLGGHNLLATGELHLGAAESLHGDREGLLAGADGDENLANLHTGNNTSGLTVSVTHTGLETISTGAGKHLVDTEHVEGVGTDAHVEGILTGVLDEVLVAGNAGSLESLRGDLLTLVREHVAHSRENVYASLLGTDIYISSTINNSFTLVFVFLAV